MADPINNDVVRTSPGFPEGTSRSTSLSTSPITVTPDPVFSDDLGASGAALRGSTFTSGSQQFDTQSPFNRRTFDPNTAPQGIAPVAPFEDIPGGPDFTPISVQPGVGTSFQSGNQTINTTFGPDFRPISTGAQGGDGGFDGQLLNSPTSPDFTPIQSGGIGGDRAITGPTEQIGPDFTGVGVGAAGVGGQGAITEGTAIGPDFSNPIGTGPETPGGGGWDPKTLVGSAAGIGRQTVTKPGTEDWRFRIGLMPGSNVLYRDGNSQSLLSPLLKTDGVVFPYTPNVLVNYRANYDKVSPTHSNFPTYFYQSSEVSDVQINATFTAQSVDEADYMMAMIHFFRSATKMFYGQDTNRGAPPPLVSVTGLGQHQFNFHKAVISQFNYSLPDDVDYIRTSAGGAGSIQAQSTRANLSGGSGNFGIFGIASRIGRLLGIGAEAGAEGPASGFKAANEGTNLARASASYVPTKMEVSLILLPVVTRAEQSKFYSTKDYANGAGLSQRGHW